MILYAEIVNNVYVPSPPMPSAIPTSRVPPGPLLCCCVSSNVSWTHLWYAHSLEHALLPVCQRSYNATGSTRLTVLWATRMQTWLRSVGLLERGRERNVRWSGEPAFLVLYNPFISVSFVGGILKGQIFLKPQSVFYCILITYLVPQIKCFTLLLYKKYAEHSYISSVKMSPTISFFY